MYSYLLKFLIAESAFQLSPGPDMALVLRAALSGNLRLAWGCVTGIMLSSLVWGIASAIGLCALIALSPKFFNFLAVIGIAWLAWLGLQMILSKESTFLSSTEKEEANNQQKYGFLKGILQGMMTDLLNPTTALFTLTFFPAFIPPGSNPSHFSLILGSVMALDTLVISGGLVLLANSLARFITNSQVTLWIDRIAGMIFLIISFQLFRETALDAKLISLFHSFFL
ncbi:LysE family translocator [Acetobacteraceae bacterium]|nr:LysE family translocator [Acetobacteraceae bacterium]